MINKNGLLFGKINIFDAVVIILLIALIAGGSYKIISVNKQTARNTVSVTYDLYIQNVRDVTYNAFAKGDSVFDFKLKEKIGTVENIEKEQGTRFLESFDGRLINALSENRYDLYVTVKTTAIKHTDGIIYAGKAKLIDGLSFEISTQKADCIATIKNVKVD